MGGERAGDEARARGAAAGVGVHALQRHSLRDKAVHGGGDDLRHGRPARALAVPADVAMPELRSRGAWTGEGRTLSGAALCKQLFSSCACVGTAQCKPRRSPPNDHAACVRDCQWVRGRGREEAAPGRRTSSAMTNTMCGRGRTAACLLAAGSVSDRDAAAWSVSPEPAPAAAARARDSKREAAAAVVQAAGAK